MYAIRSYYALGNLACAGCPETLAFRHVLKALGPDTRERLMHVVVDEVRKVNGRLESYNFV